MTETTTTGEEPRVCDYTLKVDPSVPKVEVLTPEGTSLVEQEGDSVTACIEAVATVISDDIDAWGCGPS